MWVLNLFKEPFFDLLILFIAFALFYLIKSSRKTRVVQVAVDLEVNTPYAEVEPRVFKAVAGVRGVTVTTSGSGLFVLTQRRAHPLSIIPAILLFPIGLIFLFVNDDLVLTITVDAQGNGAATRLRLIGRGEAQRIAFLKTALSAA